METPFPNDCHPYDKAGNRGRDRERLRVWLPGSQRLQEQDVYLDPFSHQITDLPCAPFSADV